MKQLVHNTMATTTTTAANANQRTAPSMIALRLWVILCMLLNALQQPSAVCATDDVVNLAPYELEAIINQLVNPSPEYQMHAAALRNQLAAILRERQLAVGEEQPLGDYDDYVEEDKRSVAALAAQGLLRQGVKRSVATLAKNGQLPTPEPEEGGGSGIELIGAGGFNSGAGDEKRNVGALARGGGMLSYGKRNVGTLARDFQLPQNGKRNLATLARLGLLGNQPKRNLAAVARYNSARMTGHGTSSGAGGSSSAEAGGNSLIAAEKRNLGALKGSPVHGAGMQQKREDEEFYFPAGYGESEYFDVSPKSYWWYPSYASYADFDWNDRRAQKRFLDTSRNPELFGIENGGAGTAAAVAAAEAELPTALWQLDADDSHDNGAKDHSDDDIGDGDGDGGSGGGGGGGSGAAEDLTLNAEMQKRHIGAVYRSGFLPSYRALRSTSSDYGFLGGRGGGGAGGGSGARTGALTSRFSRSGRARQLA